MAMSHASEEARKYRAKVVGGLGDVLAGLREKDKQ